MIKSLGSAPVLRAMPRAAGAAALLTELIVMQESPRLGSPPSRSSQCARGMPAQCGAPCFRAAPSGQRSQACLQAPQVCPDMCGVLPGLVARSPPRCQ